MACIDVCPPQILLTTYPWARPVLERDSIALRPRGRTGSIQCIVNVFCADPWREHEAVRIFLSGLLCRCPGSLSVCPCIRLIFSYPFFSNHSLNGCAEESKIMRRSAQLASGYVVLWPLKSLLLNQLSLLGMSLPKIATCGRIISQHPSGKAEMEVILERKRAFVIC